MDTGLGRQAGSRGHEHGSQADTRVSLDAKRRARPFAAWAVIAAMMLAAGCASYSGRGLKPGVARVDEVRRVMGEPAWVCPTADEGRNLVYPRGPGGLETFDVRVDKHGVLVSIENVLKESEFARIRKGSSKDDVLCIFGPPYFESYFERRRERVWDYRFMDAWGYPSRFHVLFDDAGTVTGTMQIREERSESLFR